MNAEATQTPQAPKPSSQEPRKRRLWLLLIPVAVVGIPVLIVIVLNTGDPKLPAIDEQAKAVVHVRDLSVLGSLKVEGIQRLRDLIARGKPARNPWTIVRIYWRHRRSDSVMYVRETGHLMPTFNAEAWAILMVPIPGTKDQYHAYHYIQDANLAYLDGPDGVQVLIMPFSPEGLHTELVGYEVPFFIDPEPPAGSRPSIP